MMLNTTKTVDTGRAGGPTSTPSILAEAGAVRLVFCPNACGVLIHRHGPELGPRAAHCAVSLAPDYSLADAEGIQRAMLQDMIRFMERRRWRTVRYGWPRQQTAPMERALMATL